MISSLSLSDNIANKDKAYRRVLFMIIILSEYRSADSDNSIAQITNL